MNFRDNCSLNPTLWSGGVGPSDIPRTLAALAAIARVPALAQLFPVGSRSCALQPHCAYAPSPRVQADFAPRGLHKCAATARLSNASRRATVTRRRCRTNGFRRRKPSERRNTGAGDRTQREDSGMATGLYLLQDGTIMVAYGERKIPIGPAQYKANGYKPPFEKLKAKSSSADKPLRAEYRPRDRRPAH